MLAVLRATPGRVTSSAIVAGTFPPNSSTSFFAMPRIDLVFWLKNPVGLMSAASSASGTRR